MKYLKITLIFILASLAPALFVGCGGGQFPTDDPASPTGDVMYDAQFKLFVKIATAESIDGDLDLAVKIDNGLAELQPLLDTGVIVTPEQVDGYLAELINKSSLESVTKQQLFNLTNIVSVQLAQRTDIGQLNPNVTAKLGTVIGWVREAAQDTLRFGSAPVYALPLSASAAETPDGVFYFVTGARDWDSLVQWWQTPATIEEVEQAIDAQESTGSRNHEYEMWVRKHNFSI